MQIDSLSYDTTLDSRPLPKWLNDQKSGITTIQPEKIVMREDNSLKISFVVTAVFIVLAVTILTVFLLRKNKNKI